MKKVLLILIVIISFSGFIFSQATPEFKLTKEGIKPLIIEFDSGYTANVIYTRIKEWIALNNRYPSSVTRIDKQDELIKFSCYEKYAWKITNNNIDYWNELKYTFTVEIKDYKCRITFESDEDRYDFWYNEDGTLKERFKGSEASFENTVNKTLTSLYDHIVGAEEKQSDDW